MADYANSAAQGAATGAVAGPWGAAIGAGVGLLSARQKEKATREQLAMEAYQNALTPWTRMGLTPLHAAPSGGYLQGATAGGLSGWQFGQGLNQNSQDAAEKLATQQMLKDKNVAEVDALKAQTEAYRRAQMQQGQQMSPLQQLNMPTFGSGLNTSPSPWGGGYRG